MRIAYTNYIDTLEASAISALSEDGTYPITNVQDQRLTTTWLSDEATTQTVIFDLGATTACSLVAILSHNLTSTGTVTLVGNDVIGAGMTWETSDQSSVQTITYNAGVMLTFFTPIQNRYWKLTFTGQEEDGIRIGRIWLGDYLSMSPASLNDFSVTLKNDDTVVYGRNRQKYASAGATWRQFNLSFPKSSPTMASAIKTMYDTVGTHTSLIFCNFDSLRGYPLVEPCYCSIVGELGLSHVNRQHYTYDITLEEDL
jgi:hypothetical protein